MPETYAPQSRPGHSTGPRTSNGKAIASRNSTTHGCCSRQTIIRGESEEEFNQLLEDWLLDYQPEDSLQRSFVEQAVHAQWILQRNTNRYNELERSLEEKGVLEWSEEDHKKFERFTRYKTTAERAFTRAFTQLEQLRKRLTRERDAILERQAKANPATPLAESAQMAVGAAHTSGPIAESVPSRLSRSSALVPESPLSCHPGKSSEAPRGPSPA